MRIECRHVCKSYPTRNGAVVALQDINVSLGEQEFVCIVGPSGCGKTTFLKLLAGLLAPTSGEIRAVGAFDGLSADGRPRGVLVFQEHGLFPWLTVLDNVAFGLEMQGVGRQERREQALALVTKVGLASFAHNYPHELSLGMRQRVGIARAVVSSPQILLMDEPFGSLDAQTKLVLQEELLGVWREYENLVVYVTHDIEEAVLLGDRLLVMTGRPGRIREEIPIPLGRPRDLSAGDREDIRKIKWHVWKMIQEEARQSLSLAP